MKAHRTDGYLLFLAVLLTDTVSISGTTVPELSINQLGLQEISSDFLTIVWGQPHNDISGWSNVIYSIAVQQGSTTTIMEDIGPFQDYPASYVLTDLQADTWYTVTVTAFHTSAGDTQQPGTSSHQLLAKTSSSHSSNSEIETTHLGLIIGLSVLTVCLLVIIVLFGCLLIRSIRNQSKEKSSDEERQSVNGEVVVEHPLNSMNGETTQNPYDNDNGGLHPEHPYDSLVLSSKDPRDRSSQANRNSGEGGYEELDSFSPEPTVPSLNIDASYLAPEPCRHSEHIM